MAALLDKLRGKKPRQLSLPVAPASFRLDGKTPALVRSWDHLYAAAGRFQLSGQQSMPRSLRVAFSGIYKLTADTTAFSVTGKNAILTPGSAPNSDFNTRRNSPGVFRSFAFSSPADLGAQLATGGPQFGYPTQGANYYDVAYATSVGDPTVMPVIDPTKGAMRITDKTNSLGSSGNKWMCHFSSDGSRNYFSNASVYIQFAFETTYEGYPAPYPPGYGAKFIYIGGNNVGYTGAYPQIVVAMCAKGDTRDDSGIPFAYRRFIPDETSVTIGPWNASIGESDVQLACPYPRTAGTCFRLPNNKKVYFQIGLTLGNEIPNCVSPITGQTYLGVETHFEVWVTVDGVTTKLTDYSAAQGAGYFPFQVDPAHIDGYSSVELSTYRTGAAIGDLTTDAYTWFSELILSNQQIPHPSISSRPQWFSTIRRNTITNIGTTSDTQSAAYQAAGYYLPGWTGDKGTDGYNLTAWGGGAFMPALGQGGTLVVGMNGHAAAPASTLSAFDVWNASWSIIGAPQLHRQVTPAYTDPPADAEVWYNPDGHAVGGVGVTDLSNFVYNGYPAGLTSVWRRYIETGVGVSGPFRAAPSAYYTFRSHPPTYGLRYQTNVGSAMRYDCYVNVPQAYGGEAAGTLYLYPDDVCHNTEGIGDLGVGTDNLWGWRFGCTSRTWLAHSVGPQNITDAAGYHGQVNCAHSEKYNKIFASTNNTNHMGCWDVATNNFVRVYGKSLVGTGDPTWPAFMTEEGKAIITHGHSAHLFITIGNSNNNYVFNDTSNKRFFHVMDLDEVMTATAVSESFPYAITDPAAAKGLPLLSQAIGWFSGDFSGYSMTWFRSRKKLVLFKCPKGTDLAPATVPSGRARVAPIDPGLIHIITIPEGTTGGVPNWKTQTWTVETVPITLGTGTTGVHTGAIGRCYGRFCALESLDVCLYLGAPDEGLQAQIIDVFGVGTP